MLLDGDEREGQNTRKKGSPACCQCKGDGGVAKGSKKDGRLGMYSSIMCDPLVDPRAAERGAKL